MCRGVKRDGLIQAPIDSLASSSGGIKLTGLIKVGKEKVWRGEQPYLNTESGKAGLEADGQQTQQQLVFIV